MLLAWTKDAWDEYCYWQSQDKKTLRKINRLLDDMLRNPYSGLGSPEPLKINLNGYWSRRIDEKNRIVYTLKENLLLITQCGSHYRDK